MWCRSWERGHLARLNIAGLRRIVNFGLRPRRANDGFVICRRQIDPRSQERVAKHLVNRPRALRGAPFGKMTAPQGVQRGFASVRQGMWCRSWERGHLARLNIAGLRRIVNFGLRPRRANDGFVISDRPRTPRSASRNTWLNRPRALRGAPFGKMTAPQGVQRGSASVRQGMWCRSWERGHLARLNILRRIVNFSATSIDRRIEALLQRCREPLDGALPAPVRPAHGPSPCPDRHCRDCSIMS